MDPAKGEFMIPGFIITIVTFPGVIVHEAAHMFFCKIRKVPVLDVCFFRFGNPAGYVVHGQPQDFTTSFLITMGPFIINSLLCILICLPAFVPVRIFELEHPLSYFLLWLGLSIGMHAFPSMQDANSLFSHAKKCVSARNVLAIVSFPLVVAIYTANILSFFWLDYLYGFAIGLGLPALILKLLS
jgi:hypothetical protein